MISFPQMEALVPEAKKITILRDPVRPHIHSRAVKGEGKSYSIYPPKGLLL